MERPQRIDELLAQARSGVDRVTPAGLAEELAAGALVVDTRPREQRERDGELPGAVVIDRNVLEWRLDPTSPDRIPQATDHDRRIVVVCSEGYSSSLAAASLRRLGLHLATDLAGGYRAWLAATDAAARQARHDHWEEVHRGGASDAKSWYQPEPRVALELVDRLGIGPDDPVVDVGGGATGLTAALLDRDARDVTVLDVSEAACARARDRLGARADAVRWVVADVLAWRPERRYALWHDRAVFHFLVDPDDRAAYRATLESALVPGGAVVLGTFAADGPERCSGLPVARYDPDGLVAALGPGFTRLATRREEHVTPAGVVQPFTWVALRAASTAESPRRGTVDGRVGRART